MNKMSTSDVLIIGSGIAGCCTALKLAERKIKVTLITKMSSATESNTKYAQGGIAGRGHEDSPDLLMEDIQKAGDHLVNKEAVEMLAQEGPDMLIDLLIDHVGVEFNRDENNDFEFTSEAVHSARRIFHVMDHTGKDIINKLIAKIEENPYITLLTNHQAIDLITTGHHLNDPLRMYNTNKCLGAYVYDVDNNVVNVFLAKKTVLSTGGIGSLFLHSSNPACATGDGIAMAYRTGADIINAEYVQFHPTTLFHRDANRFLVSEALRGEGARLKNIEGDYFMDKYDPLKDLAPRDVISRAIYDEIHNHQLYTGHETFDISRDEGMPVNEEYALKGKFKFTEGQLHKVIFDIE